MVDWKERKQHITAVSVLLMFSLIIVYRNSNGFVGEPITYIIDSKDFVQRLFYTWDDRVYLGHPWGTEIGYLLIALFYSSLTWFLPLDFVQALWHFSLLSLAGLGAYFLLSIIFRKVDTISALGSSVVYMCSFYSIIYLRNTVMLFPYSLLPWILGFFIRGIKKEGLQYVLASALFASLLPAINPPIVVIALTPILFFSLYDTIIPRLEKEEKKNFFTAKSLSLFIIIYAFMNIWWIIPVCFSAPQSQRILAQSVERETPSLLNRHSSFTEVFRGIGLWSLYVGASGKPYYSWFNNFTQPFYILTSFVVPCIAFMSIFFVKRFEHYEKKMCIFFLILVLVAIPLCVGAYPPDNPSFSGKFFLLAYYNIPFFNAFKSTYKFSLWIFLAYTVFIAIFLYRIQHALAFKKMEIWKKSRKMLAILLIAFSISPSVLPILNGTVYENSGLILSFPDYWLNCSDWINNQEGDFRVLIFPSSPQGFYKWGVTRGEIQLALLHKSQLTLFSGLLAGTVEGDRLVRRIYDLLSQNNTKAAMMLCCGLNVKYVVSGFDLDEKSTKITGSELKSILSPLEEAETFDDTVIVYKNPYFEDRFICTIENYSREDIDKLITSMGNGIYAQSDTVTYSWLEDMSYLPANFSDFEADFSVKIIKGNAVALNFVTPEEKYYSFQIRTDGCRIEKSQVGRQQISVPTDIRVESNRWHSVHVSKKEGELMLFIGSQKAAFANDDEFKYGHVGFSTWNTIAYFDNLVVKEDLTAGREVVNESFDDYQFGQAPSTWKLYDEKRSNWKIGIDNERNPSITVDKIFGNILPFVTAYQKVDPTKYVVDVNATKPFLLCFAETYDPLWVAHVNGEKVDSIPLYSVLNGFWINQTGQLKITIEYRPQKWFYYGSIISAATFLGCLTYLTYNWTKNKNITKQTKRFIARMRLMIHHSP